MIAQVVGDNEISPPAFATPIELGIILIEVFKSQPTSKKGVINTLTQFDQHFVRCILSFFLCFRFGYVQNILSIETIPSTEVPNSSGEQTEKNADEGNDSFRSMEIHNRAIHAHEFSRQRFSDNAKLGDICGADI